jgi:hypothetical protein
VRDPSRLSVVCGRVNSVATILTDEASLLPLLTHKQMNLKELGNSNTMPDPFPSIVSAGGHPVQDIAQCIEPIRTLRVDVACEGLMISKTLSVSNVSQTLGEC